MAIIRLIKGMYRADYISMQNELKCSLITWKVQEGFSRENLVFLQEIFHPKNFFRNQSRCIFEDLTKGFTKVFTICKNSSSLSNDRNWRLQQEFFHVLFVGFSCGLFQKFHESFFLGFYQVYFQKLFNR